MSAHGRRAILHVDMDCFYAAVERLRHPETQGKPLVVVMYGEWRGGAIIAVSYEARAFGIKRNMRGDDAKRLCPGCHVVTVETANGKADLESYRDASAQVMTLLQSVAGPQATLERASVDECYIDVSAAAAARMGASSAEQPELLQQQLQLLQRCQLRKSCQTMDLQENWHRAITTTDRSPLTAGMLESRQEPAPRPAVVDEKEDALLLHASLIANEMRVAVKRSLGFTCSAGVAHNKILAKLATGMLKPDGQTTLLQSCVPSLLAALPISELRGFGGKLGDSLRAATGGLAGKVGNLLTLDEPTLQAQHGPRLGTWVWNIVRGVNFDLVTTWALAKSVGVAAWHEGLRASDRRTHQGGSLARWHTAGACRLTHQPTKRHSSLSRAQVRAAPRPCTCHLRTRSRTCTHCIPKRSWSVIIMSGAGRFNKSCKQRQRTSPFHL
jgi:DNA polymerase eta